MLLPNLVTLLRIALIPLIIFTYYMPGEIYPWARGLALVLFILSAITDWLDGHLARRYNMMSDLGRFLDPIADKLAVAAVLVMLVMTNRIAGIDVIAAYLILAREIFISGLREFLGGIKDPIVLPVSPAAKWKTGTQMVALIGYMAVDACPPLEGFVELASIALWISAILSVVTGYEYFKAGWRYLNSENR
jgi:cardiolipin synthase